MKKLRLLLACFFLLTILAGCGEKPAAGPEDRPRKDAGEITIIDNMGREVTLPHKAERIISLVPSNTELLFALGLGEKVVGVSEYCNYPPEALEKPKAGSFSEPNIEQIVALQPHLVVAVPLQEEDFARMEELNIPVLALDPSNLEEIYSVIQILGRAAGEEEQAFLLESELREKISAVKEKVSQAPRATKVRVYYEVYSDPLMTVGGNTVIHDLIGAAGGENIFAELEESYPKISAEAVLDRDPEVIVFPNYHGTEGFLANEIMNRPGWGTITAIKDNRLYGVDADMISRPGPRVAEAVEVLSDLFYPHL